MTPGRHAGAPRRRVDLELPDEQLRTAPSRRAGAPESVDLEPPDLQVRPDAQSSSVLSDEQPYQTRSGRAIKKPSRFL